MPDNVGYTPGTGATVAADDIGGVLHQRVKIGIGPDGVATDVSSTNPLPVVVDDATPISVSGPLTNAQLRASAVPVSIQGNPTVTVDLSDLRNLSAATVNLLDSPRGYDKSLQRQRGTVIVESGTVTTVSTVTTCSTVTTVSTVTNLSTIDNIQGRIGQLSENLSAWAGCVRARIT